MLVPVLVLVLIVLGAIAVDSATVALGQRELADYTSQAADQGAAVALNDSAFYNNGVLRLDPGVAETLAATMRAQIGNAVHDVRDQVTVAPNGTTVTVEAWGTVDAIFARAVPGVAHQHTVHAISHASPRPLALP
jgi:hypothetical protein